MNRRVIRSIDQIRSALEWATDAARRGLDGGKPVVLTVTRETRSLESNAKMWAMLGEVAAQLTWHGLKLSPDDWKNMFTASLKRQRSVPNIDGNGFVMLGESTSRMTVSEMNDLITLMDAFGAEHGVKFRAPERHET